MIISLRNKKKKSPKTIDTLIGEGTVIEGKLITKSSIRIEGTINGDIDCAGDVIIGEKGAAHSNLFAKNVINAGMIQGSITAKELLTITRTGKVLGNIHAPSLSVAEGGTFQGMSRMDMKSSNNAHPDKNPEHIPHPAKTDKADKITIVK
jgi:cytoskeletal protein CcmA (bactofilin family)